jgi:hypothetical protein
VETPERSVLETRLMWELPFEFKPGSLKELPTGDSNLLVAAAAPG